MWDILQKKPQLICEDRIQGSKENMLHSIYQFLWDFINSQDPVETKECLNQNFRLKINYLLWVKVQFESFQFPIHKSWYCCHYKYLDIRQRYAYNFCGRFNIYRWGGRGHYLLLALSQKILSFLKQALVVVSAPYALYKIFRGGGICTYCFTPSWALMV